MASSSTSAVVNRANTPWPPKRPPSRSWRNLPIFLQVLRLTDEEYEQWVASDHVKPHALRLLAHIQLRKRLGLPTSAPKVTDVWEDVRRRDWDLIYLCPEDLQHPTTPNNPDPEPPVEGAIRDIEHYSRFAAQVSRSIHANFGRPGIPLSHQIYSHDYLQPCALVNQRYDDTILRFVWHFWLRLRDQCIRSGASTSEKRLLGLPKDFPYCDFVPQIQEQGEASGPSTGSDEVQDV